MLVSCDLDGCAVREDIAALARITGDPDGVNTALEGQVGLFAWWMTLEARAAEAEQTAKDALDALEADLMEGADPKATVTAQKAAARRDPRWEKLHAAHRAAQAQAGMIRVGRKTCEERKDALREMAALLRTEMETGLGRFGVRSGGRDAAAQADAADRENRARLRK